MTNIQEYGRVYESRDANRVQCVRIDGGVWRVQFMRTGRFLPKDYASEALAYHAAMQWGESKNRLRVAPARR